MEISFSIFGCRFLLSVLTERGTNDVFCYAVSIDTNNRFLVHYGQERNGKLGRKEMASCFEKRDALWQRYIHSG